MSFRNLLIVGFIVGCMLLLLYMTYYGNTITKLYTEGFTTSDTGYPVVLYFVTQSPGGINSADYKTVTQYNGQDVHLFEGITETSAITTEKNRIEGLLNDIEGVEVLEILDASIDSDYIMENLSDDIQGKLTLNAIKNIVNLSEPMHVNSLNQNVFHIFVFPFIGKNHFFELGSGDSALDKNILAYATNSIGGNDDIKSIYENQEIGIVNMVEYVKGQRDQLPFPTADTPTTDTPTTDTPTTDTPTTDTPTTDTPTTDTPTTDTPTTDTPTTNLPSNITLNFPDKFVVDVTGIPSTINHSVNVNGFPSDVYHNLNFENNLQYSSTEDYESEILPENPIYTDSTDSTDSTITGGNDATSSIFSSFLSGLLGNTLN